MRPLKTRRAESLKASQEGLPSAGLKYMCPTVTRSAMCRLPARDSREKLIICACALGWPQPRPTGAQAHEDIA
eukprot:4733838-Prymnesium_polylepis.1